MAIRALRRFRTLRHVITRFLSSSSAAAAAADANAICRVLSDHRSPTHDLESALRPFASVLTPDLLESALKRCRNLPSATHRLFLFASSLPNFSPSPLSHRLLIESLAASRQFPLAWAHLSDHRHVIAPDFFHVLFFAYSKANLPADAIRAFEKMPGFGLNPSLDQLHTLLYALCRQGHVQKAQAFFHSVKSEYPVTSKTYSILIQGWANAGQSKDAIELFDEMRRRGLSCEIDIPACNALLAALCKAGELDEASKRLKEMRTVHGLEPDAASYAVFIRAYCEAKDSHAALRMIENMRRKGLVPNLFTYNCVIRLLCEEDEKVTEAYDLLDEMFERGVKPDVWSYNRILSVHCKLREVNKALKLFKKMDEDGCLPDRHTYNMLMKMLIGVGRIDRAVEVWDGMEERGFYPSACSYAVMIHGLCRKKGRAEEACRYFEVMVDEGVPPYASTCVLLRRELLRLGLKEKVEVLTDRMQRSTSRTIQELSSVMETGKEIEKCAPH